MDRFTVRLQCETEMGQCLLHAFLFSPTCPTPLMGRDLMCILNGTLVVDSSGIKVMEKQLCCPLIESREPRWAYEWHIENTDWAQTMCELAKNLTMPCDNEIMIPADLHCTSHVVGEWDEEYEDWFKIAGAEKLTLSLMFWTKHMCAISVSLMETQLPFYLAESVPHLSLSKTLNQSWASLGLFVKN